MCVGNGAFDIVAAEHKFRYFSADLDKGKCFRLVVDLYDLSRPFVTSKSFSFPAVMQLCFSEVVV